MVCSGLLALAALYLLALAAGRGLAMDAQAGIMAGIYAAGGLGVAVLAAAAAAGEAGAFSPTASAARALPHGEPLLLLACLAGCLLAVLLPLATAARRGGALLLFRLIPALCLATFTGVSLLWLRANRLGLSPVLALFDVSHAWSMLTPLSAMSVPHPACLGVPFSAAASYPLWLQLEWPVQLAFQLALVAGLLRAALDNIPPLRDGAE